MQPSSASVCIIGRLFRIFKIAAKVTKPVPASYSWSSQQNILHSTKISCPQHSRYVCVNFTGTSVVIPIAKIFLEAAMWEFSQQQFKLQILFLVRVAYRS